MNSHRFVKNSEIGHGHKVVCKVAISKVHDYFFKTGISLSTSTVNKESIVSRKKQDENAMNYRYNSVSEVEPIQTLEIPIVKFQVHHNNV